MAAVVPRSEEAWPALSLEQWKDTYATLHMWTQIVGKIRLALTPLINHWWNVPLYVDGRVLTTSAIPYGATPSGLSFDFIDHQFLLHTSDGTRKVLPLVPMSVADFYKSVMSMLRSSGIEVTIWRMPVEVPDPTPFDEDRRHASYDPDAVQRFWKILLNALTSIKSGSRIRIRMYARTASRLATLGCTYGCAWSVDMSAAATLQKTNMPPSTSNTHNTHWCGRSSEAKAGSGATSMKSHRENCAATILSRCTAEFAYDVEMARYGGKEYSYGGYGRRSTNHAASQRT